MAGILKNQLVKRLASFTKGLSVDKIDLDILSGRGYLDNLELDEQFMSSVLELPLWMEFTKILCSKIRLKVSFTKLKSEPIQIVIDTVYVEAEIGKACTRREINIQQKLMEAGLAQSATSYGYMEQVIDGMHITVSSIKVTLTTKHFLVTTELNGVELYSTNRKWKGDDLRKTRAYVLPQREEVLVYKMLTVSYAKFEFFEKNSCEGAPPLKFNFNMITLLITMKKCVATNEVVSACLKLILDDILLVVTPSQLQILLALAKELTDVIELNAPKAAKSPSPVQKSPYMEPKSVSKSFVQRFSRQQTEEDDDNIVEIVTDNIIETSYHLKTGTIDFLLCDDVATNASTGGSGSLQFRFEVVQVEIFPHRTGNASRKHWTLPIQYVKDAQSNNWTPVPRKHVQPAQVFSGEMLGDYAESRAGLDADPLAGLHEMIVILRCEHFQLLPVMGVHKRKVMGPLLFSDKTKFGLNETEPAMLITMAMYYREKQEDHVPPGNIYLHLNPVEINFDEPTVWWLREFIGATMTDEFKAMLTQLGSDKESKPPQLKINLVLPHITIPLTDISAETSDITGLQFWFSKVVISNLCNRLYLPLLSHLVEAYESPDFTSTSTYPNEPSDKVPLPNLTNHDQLHSIIDDLMKKEKFKEQLLEEKMRQRNPRYRNRSPSATPSMTGTSTPITTRMTPDTPSNSSSNGHSRRGSISSVNIVYNGTLPGQSNLNFTEMFPELAKTLCFEFETFSADFLYATEHGSPEQYRSRKFVSDVPLTMWLIEQEPKEELESNPHKKLSRLSTLTNLAPEPAPEYLILLKSHKSIHCSLDRAQYVFLMKLQQEIQSFVDKIVLAVAQIFSGNIQETTDFTMLGLFDHVVCDMTLPMVEKERLDDAISLPDTASTGISHVSSPLLNSARVSVCEEDILLEEGEENKKINWIVLSKSETNLTTLSEIISVKSHSDDDSISLSSMTTDFNPLAKGDSKETLLKFLMRVNKKKETASVSCQTTTDIINDIVADTYQQIHKPLDRIHEALYRPDQNFSNHPTSCIQIHAAAAHLIIQASERVSTKIVSQKVQVFDSPDDFQHKAHSFPHAKWCGLGTESQLRIRIDVTPIKESHSQTICEMRLRNLRTKLDDQTLERAGAFFEPHPDLESQPIELQIEVQNCCVDINLVSSGRTENISVGHVSAKKNEDDSWIIGAAQAAQVLLISAVEKELEDLKKENELLKEQLKLMLTVKDIDNLTNGEC